LFLSKGIPVIIGEFGAMNKDNEADRVEWAKYYLSKAKEIGVPCIWCDNNSYDGSGENFGLFDRRTLTFPYEELVNAMMTTVGAQAGWTGTGVAADSSQADDSGKADVVGSDSEAVNDKGTDTVAIDLSALEGKKLIAITVDDGPDGSGTKEFIRVATEYEAPLTFFVVGKYIANNAGQLKEMLAAGCEIGNHSMTHNYLTEMDAAGVQEEIQQTDALIEKVAPDAQVSFVRAPYFAYNDVVYQNVDYPLIDAALQESGTDYEATLQILLGASDGDIMLMHTWNTASLKALEEAIPKLRDEGFEFVTVSQLFAARGMEALDGTVYRHVGENLANKYEVVKNLFTGENTASGDWSNWQTAVDLDKAAVASMTDGQAIQVEYKATVGPCLILQSWSGGPGWVQMTPSSDDGKTAIFTYEDMVAAYGGPLENLDASMVRPYGADLTVTCVDILKLSE
ncbi:MAG: polysaccharide deacetylase family protein, partial [Lachnospiraceae bacterium]|nr:polysaccharide deacetylase family protein [Lachnospiraceae bacterium]